MFDQYDVFSWRVIRCALVLTGALSLLGLTLSRSLGSPTEDNATHEDSGTQSVTGIDQPEAGTRAQIFDERLPLSFEANYGQTNPEVDFIARGSGYTIFLTPRQAVLMLREAASLTQRRGQGPARAIVLRLQLVGAAQPHIASLDKLPGNVNYIRGSDPVRWRTNIPTYAEVRYKGIYPGIDLAYYGNQHQLEYDFIVRPGADPERIVLAFEGAEKIEVDHQGDLVLHVAGGAVRHRRPVVYQEVDGTRREIAGGYMLKGARGVGFTLAEYDKSRPLVIDPVLFYSSYLGGADDDDTSGIAVDSNGFTYVTGGTVSIDFPTTAGAVQVSRANLTDTFVTKLDPGGSALVYATYLGGTGNDEGRSIAVDGAGNAYIVGGTSSIDFPTTTGAFQTTRTGVGADGFITKLNPSGSALVYSTYVGGANDDEALSIAINASGNAYVTGEASSTDFPTTSGALRRTLSGVSDAFVAKLDPSGTALVYSTYLGGGSDDDGRGIAIDSTGNSYVTGETLSVDFPTTAGAFRLTRASNAHDAYVTKLNPSASALVYSTYLGGTRADRGFAIALDALPDPNAYVAGRTLSTDFPTTAGAFRVTLAGNAFDAFVTKLNPAGSALVYSTYVGGTGEDTAHGIAVNSLGNAYATGRTFSTDFPTTAGAFQAVRRGSADAFVTKLNPAGSALVYSTYFGGGGLENGFGIAVDAVGSAYVTGETLSADLPTTAGAFDTTFNGIEDAFVAKIADFGPSTSLTLTPNASTTTVNTQHCVTATARDAAGNPVAGVTVRFAVTGTHTASSAATADATGQALFCYTGMTAGNDTLTAFADTNHSGSEDPGEPGDTATNTWSSP